YHLAVALGFRPKIDALDALDLGGQFEPLGDDVAVAEPGGFLVRMILRAPLDERLQRPGARHADSSYLQRPKDRLGVFRIGEITADQLVPGKEIDGVRSHLGTDFPLSRYRRGEAEHGDQSNATTHRSSQIIQARAARAFPARTTAG